MLKQEVLKQVQDDEGKNIPQISALSLGGFFQESTLIMKSFMCQETGYRLDSNFCPISQFLRFITILPLIHPRFFHDLCVPRNQIYNVIALDLAYIQFI